MEKVKNEDLDEVSDILQKAIKHIKDAKFSDSKTYIELSLLRALAKMSSAHNELEILLGTNKE